MAQVINTNSLSLAAQKNLNKSQSSLSNSIERLSSGLRINSAKDDAAGLAIANRFTANIRGMAQAARNANDGISIAQTTEGALDEINNNLQRIRELTVQAENGTNSDTDLHSIQSEIDQRLAEIEHISQQTTFNGVKVLSANAGKLTIQAGASDGETVDIDLQEISPKTLGLEKFSADGIALDKKIQNGTMVNVGKPVTLGSLPAIQPGDDKAQKLVVYESSNVLHYALQSTANPGNFYDTTVDENGTVAVVNSTTAHAVSSKALDAVKASTETYRGGETGFQRKALITGLFATDEAYQYTDKASNETKYVVKGTDGKYREASDTLGTTPGDIGALTIRVNAMAKELTDLKTRQPLKLIDAALTRLDQSRSALGAIQNRLDSTINTLNNSVNNLSAARSRIEDADYATEVSNMTRAQILQQSGSAVLAQANQVPQTVLSLLK